MKKVIPAFLVMFLFSGVDSGFDKGDLVTVYYNSGRGLRVDTWAEKVVVHTKHSGRKNYNR